MVTDSTAWKVQGKTKSWINVYREEKSSYDTSQQNRSTKNSQLICMSVCSPFSGPPLFPLYLFTQPISVSVVPAICALVVNSLRLETESLFFRLSFDWPSASIPFCSSHCTVYVSFLALFFLLCSLPIFSVSVFFSICLLPLLVVDSLFRLSFGWHSVSVLSFSSRKLTLLAYTQRWTPSLPDSWPPKTGLKYTGRQSDTRRPLDVR